ncbi:MAG: ribbon-helix-helix domain-containing protein [Polyangiaceae bacterium]|nr:ribbon-helix-helix domain-containing protein [Polyangiaceae bacterium]
MGLNASIPVRFDRAIAARLKTISENTGIPVSHLVRIATEQYLVKIEESRTLTIAVDCFKDGKKKGTA